MGQSAVVEVQPLQRQEAGVGTDWATIGIYFLKGVHLLVHPLVPHHPHTAVTETAATKGIDAGTMLFHVNFLTVTLRVNESTLKLFLNAPSDSGSQSDSSMSSDLRPQLSRRNQRGARGRGNDRDRGRGERGRGRGKANRGRR